MNLSSPLVFTRCWRREGDSLGHLWHSSLRMGDQPASTVEFATGSDRADGLPHALAVSRVVCAHGPSVGLQAVLEKGQHLVFGRAPEGTGAVPLADPSTSRQHASLEWTESGLVVRDLGSKNGTWVDGVKLEGTVTVRDGSVIRLGGTVLVVESVELQKGAKLLPASQELWGDSLLLQQLRGELATVAPSNLPVLVLGETGVGKERVAAELHRLSARKGALVPVNCAAIASHLAESELFGHVAGAFTGAQRASEGVFVAASGGTLFLDEVGELPLDLQPKLLRALADGEVRPVGGSRATKVDVRVVAATLRDLTQAVAERTFREDLYSRLQAWVVKVPPLRARRLDVATIGRRLLEKHGVKEVSADVAEALLLHDWRFNVRELEQVISVCVVKAAGAKLRRDHLPTALSDRLGARGKEPAVAAPPPLELSVPRDVQPDAEALSRALTHFKGNVVELADYFGKDRKQVYRWLERFGLDPSTFR